MEAAAGQMKRFQNRLVWDFGARKPAPSWEAFVSVLDDDFRTPDALAIMHEWTSAGQRELLERALVDVFGVQLKDIIAPPARVNEMAEARCDARRRRNFGEADRIRDELIRLNWEVRDVAHEPGYLLVPISRNDPRFRAPGT
jgi:cysteinyl-tRNA synthetase